MVIHLQCSSIVWWGCMHAPELTSLLSKNNLQRVKTLLPTSFSILMVVVANSCNAVFCTMCIDSTFYYFVLCVRLPTFSNSCDCFHHANWITSPFQLSLNNSTNKSLIPILFMDLMHAVIVLSHLGQWPPHKVVVIALSTSLVFDVNDLLL